MANDSHLQRNDFQLLAGFLADHLFAGAAGTGALVLGQLVDDIHARQVSRKRLALSTSLHGDDDFFGLGFVRSASRLFEQLLSLVEHGQLRGSRPPRGFGLWREQFVAQQSDLLLKLQNQGLGQVGIVGRGVCARFHGAGLYWLSSQSAGSAPSVAVPPEVETCQQLIQFPHRQHDGLLRIRLGLKRSACRRLNHR